MQQQRRISVQDEEKVECCACCGPCFTITAEDVLRHNALLAEEKVECCACCGPCFTCSKKDRTTVIWIVVAMILLLALYPVGFGIVSSILGIVVAALMTIYYICKKTPQFEIADYKALSGNIDEVSVSSESEAKPKPKKERLYCLDNLKIFLTVMVVMHHITCMTMAGAGWNAGYARFHHVYQIPANVFLTANQSYFMCLFFFISGYFTPSSYLRKGQLSFLKDKYSRLGIPLCVYAFIFGPLHNLFISYFMTEHKSYSYFPDNGPCWFLVWLLLLNTLYVCFNSESVEFALPSMYSLSLWGLLLGAIQFGLVLLVGGAGAFICMPISFGSLPFDILFFVGGIWCRKNGWMEQIFNLKTRQLWFAWFVSVMYPLISIALYIYSYTRTDGFGIIPREDGKDLKISAVSGATFAGMFVISGAYTFCFSICLINLFKKYFNSTGNILKFMTRNAYAVYLIHPLVITPMAWTFQLILDDQGHKLYWEDDDNFSHTEYPEHLVFLGWLYTTAISLLVVWPLAHVFRQLPGVRDLL